MGLGRARLDRAARFAAPYAGVLLVAALLGTGCITPSQYVDLRRDVDQLKAGGSGSSVPGTGDDRLAELAERMVALDDEVARLRGQLEETRYLAEEALKEARAARDAAPVGPAAPGGSGEPPPPDELISPVSAEIRTYEEAFARYRAGDYEAAIDQFRAFLQTHPSSEYADNALFWMGECYFKLGDYERAVLTFEDVVNRFPDGNKVPDALYRQGIALLELGERSKERETYTVAAREIFERLVEEHPDSERVPEAQRKLETLGQ